MFEINGNFDCGSFIFLYKEYEIYIEQEFLEPVGEYYCSVREKGSLKETFSKIKGLQKAVKMCIDWIDMNSGVENKVFTLIRCSIKNYDEYDKAYKLAIFWGVNENEIDRIFGKQKRRKMR